MLCANKPTPEVEALVEALRPFARYAKAREHAWRFYRDDAAHYGCKKPGGNVTIGDYRTAARIVDAYDGATAAAEGASASAG